jgi:hypothetical protein
MLLKSSSESKAPHSAPAEADATSAQPAVLASDQVGVRDYRERLADLKEKDPFKQQFAATPTDVATGATGATGLSGTTPTPTSTGSVPSSSTVPGGPPPGISSVTSPPTSFPGGSGSDGDGGGNGGNGSGNHTEVVHQLLTRRVDVKVGPHGDTKLEKGVKPMTVLPGDAKPVVAFLGTDEGGKEAAFVVSSDVTSVSGVGTCVPSLADCLYVTLRKGEQVSLDYAPDGVTYDLKLVGIRDVKVKQ